MDPIFHRQDAQPHLREALEMLSEVQTLQDALQDVLEHDGARSSPAALLELVRGRMSDVEDKLEELDAAIAEATRQLEEVGRKTAPAFAELGAKLSAPVGAQ
jgi:uncharacterized protein YukE